MFVFFWGVSLDVFCIFAEEFFDYEKFPPAGLSVQQRMGARGGGGSVRRRPRGSGAAALGALFGMTGLQSLALGLGGNGVDSAGLRALLSCRPSDALTHLARQPRRVI